MILKFTNDGHYTKRIADSVVASGTYTTVPRISRHDQVERLYIPELELMIDSLSYHILILDDENDDGFVHSYERALTY